MTPSEQLLEGKRILVVEDEILVALLIEDMLADLGCIILGPFNTVSKALRAAVTERVDLALLEAMAKPRFHRAIPTGGFAASRSRAGS